MPVYACKLKYPIYGAKQTGEIWDFFALMFRNRDSMFRIYIFQNSEDLIVLDIVVGYLAFGSS